MPVSKLAAALLCLISVTPAQTPLFQALDKALPAELEASGDFNGDANIDFLSKGGILLNDGHARFTLFPVPSLPLYRTRTKAADLNGDGLTDLIVGSSLPTLGIYLNGGGLVFTLAQTLAFGPTFSPGDFATGDVEGDSDADLLIGTSQQTGPHTILPGPATLWLNNGAGIFTQAPATSIPAGALPYSGLILRDLDGDSDQDAVFGNLIAMNSGGTFTLTAAPILPAWFTSLAIGNLNNDALPDFVLVISGAAVVILNSPGGFLAPVTSPRPANVSYAPVDLNGDGVDELLEWSAPQVLTVIPMAPGGLLGPTTQTWSGLFLLGWPTSDPLVHDLDGDGDRDVIAFRHGEAVTLMNAGNGSLVRVGGHVMNFELITSLASHVADVDGDGDPDAVGVDFTGVIATGLNDGDGYFGPGLTPPLVFNNYYAFNPFDRDGDGDVDLYASLEMVGTPGPPPGPDFVLDNTGGSFTIFAAVPSTGDARGFVSADFDGDGDRDVILGRWIISPTAAGPMTYIANLGAAGFAAPIPVGTSHFNYDLDLGDFDGNGWIDVFQTNNNQTLLSPADPCVVYLNSGTGSFTPVTVPGVSGHFTAVGDLNGDGWDDVVVDGATWLSIGGGAFVPGPLLFSSVVGPISLADVDLDGDLDLVETPATVMFNSGPGLGATVSYRPRAAAGWYYTEISQSAVVDVDRDGDPDIVAPGPTVLMNTTRQLAHGSWPRPGRPASVDLYGTPGGAWFLFGSNGTTSFPFPPWGTVMIDPASAQLGALGTFAGPAAALPGTASFGVTLPNNPALVGWTTYWQAIDVTQMRFTNRLTVTVLSY